MVNGRVPVTHERTAAMAWVSWIPWNVGGLIGHRELIPSILAFGNPQHPLVTGNFPGSWRSSCRRKKRKKKGEGNGVSMGVS